MKNRALLTFLLIIIGGICLHGQEKYNIKVSYKMMLNLVNYEEINSTLLCNNKQAFFKYKKEYKNDLEEESTDERGNLTYQINIKDDTEYFIVSNLYGNSEELKKGLGKKSYYIVEEVLPAIKWEITRETKKIGEYICFKALARFRGRNYTAWFTPQVPVLFGPYKFHGLKGLILEIADDTKEVMFRAEKIEYVQLPIQKKDKKIKRVSKEFYKKKIHSFFDDLQRKLTSRGDRNIKIEVKTEIKTIEIEEN
ncbi:putative GLPGLI family protein [Tenacibaculum sp. 190524A02b]|uniref:GLPGLI family protein n=1 Tax=Tenacibaculum vairaonense TaxID=3137860 RepID=UPI0032B301CD